MPRVTYKFFKTGQPFKGKKPDVTIDLFRSDLVNIKNWTAEEKQHALEFMDSIEKTFNVFASEIHKQLRS